MLEGKDSRTQVELLAEIARLQEQLEAFKICPTYGIYTRAGVEHEWERIRRESNIAIAYCDIDNLKEKNTVLGHSCVDDLLANAFANVRESDKAPKSLLGRYYSGDEFIFLAKKEDILIPCERFAKALALPADPTHTLTATIAVTPYLGQKALKDAIADAATVVAIAKKCGRKNTIINLLPC